MQCFLIFIQKTWNKILQIGLLEHLEFASFDFHLSFLVWSNWATYLAFLWCRSSSLSSYFYLHVKIRHGAGTGLREVLKCHGAGGGKMVCSTTEQVSTGSLNVISGLVNFSVWCSVYYFQMERQHQEWLEDLVIRLLCVFALDRFGDFVSDEVSLSAL